MDAEEAWKCILKHESRWTFPLGNRLIHLPGKGSDRLRRLVSETRANWLSEMTELISRIHVPVVLLYWSKRRPDYTERYWTLYALLADFPQLVNRPMVEELAGQCDCYVECVTRVGANHRLLHRETGQPVRIDLSLSREELKGNWSRNRYYPSPAMHEVAADALLPVCRELLR
jgi:hypothetical protein